MVKKGLPKKMRPTVLCSKIQGEPENNRIGRRHYSNTKVYLMLLQSK